jgi:ElaA protein
MPDTTLRWRDFAELTPRELYDVLRLRCAVFIVEQNCAYADIDGNDPQARHLLAYLGPDFVGCLRLFTPEAAGSSARLGRIVVEPAHRAAGLGRVLMRTGLTEVRRLCGAVPVELSAQSHLERFYAGLGFARFTDDYLEDGIPHCDMRREA